MNNQVVFCIIFNEYKNTPNELLGTGIDCEGIKRVSKLHRIRRFTLKNKTKEELLCGLEQHVGIISEKTVKPTTAVIFYSGHGSYSKSKMQPTILTEDKQRIYLNEILKYFSEFENLICIFDACLTLNQSTIKSKNVITNNRAIILFATSIGSTALETSSTGGYLIHTVTKELESDNCVDLLKTNTFITTFATLMPTIAVEYIVNIRNRRVCKFNANNGFRKRYPNECSAMKRITKENKINAITISNDIAAKDIIAEETPKIKPKERPLFNIVPIAKTRPVVTPCIAEIKPKKRPLFNMVTPEVTPDIAKIKPKIKPDDAKLEYKKLPSFYRPEKNLFNIT